MNLIILGRVLFIKYFHLSSKITVLPSLHINDTPYSSNINKKKLLHMSQSLVILCSHGKAVRVLGCVQCTVTVSTSFLMSTGRTLLTRAGVIWVILAGVKPIRFLVSMTRFLINMGSFGNNGSILDQEYFLPTLHPSHTQPPGCII